MNADGRGYEIWNSFNISDIRVIRGKNLLKKTRI
jgi:hypothetical protein